MKVCYCDETGTGSEPIAAMAGILTDCSRMHLTKAAWSDLLGKLSEVIGKPVPELHTRDFYSGNGIWHGLEGQYRARVIDAVCDWFLQRKHNVVYVAAVKEQYKTALDEGSIPEGLGTIWRFLGFHLVLAVQRALQKEPKNKGNTLLVFDNEHKEETRFPDLVLKPPAMSDAYYKRAKSQVRLDQVVDVPYFADSRDVSLIQLADFAAFFIRRHAEIQEGLVAERYIGEAQKVSRWVEAIGQRSIGACHIYPRKGRCDLAELFFSLAPACIRDLGAA